jgi:hypothetical protein
VAEEAEENLNRAHMAHLFLNVRHA